MDHFLPPLRRAWGLLDRPVARVLVIALCLILSVAVGTVYYLADDDNDPNDPIKAVRAQDISKMGPLWGQKPAPKEPKRRKRKAHPSR